MSTVKMTVEFTIEFAGTDDEIGELSLEGDVLHELVSNGRWHEDGWRVWGARIVGEVQQRPDHAIPRGWPFVPSV